jgi:hypothetical protein
LPPPSLRRRSIVRSFSTATSRAVLGPRIFDCHRN